MITEINLDLQISNKIKKAQYYYYKYNQNHFAYTFVSAPNVLLCVYYFLFKKGPTLFIIHQKIIKDQHSNVSDEKVDLENTIDNLLQ